MAKKKKSNSKSSVYKRNLESCLLCQSKDYNIDKNEAQYGRDHDDIVKNNQRRASSRAQTCKGSRGRCDTYFNK